MEIDKHIPVPEGERRGNKRSYPFDTLEVGESFSVDLKLERSVRTAASQGNKKDDGRSFTCQKQPDGTIRCWRTT